MTEWKGGSRVPALQERGKDGRGKEKIRETIFGKVQRWQRGSLDEYLENRNKRSRQREKALWRKQGMQSEEDSRMEEGPNLCGSMYPVGSPAAVRLSAGQGRGGQPGSR